jgi:AAHS family 3-hydroxyphenylpropionic acid transporter
LPVVLCCLAAVCEGFDLQAPGVTARAVSSVFGMNAGQTGLFLSISTFGMMLGALFGGRMSDQIGRKWVLIGSIALYSVCTVGTALATSHAMLLSIRFAAGIGLGGALPTLVTLAVESVTHERRSTAVGLILMGPPIGGALVSLLAAAVATPERWQLLYLAGGVGPLAIVVPLLIAFLPNRRVVSEADTVGSPRSKRAVLTLLFGDGRAARTIAVWFGLFSILWALFVLAGWLPTLMVDRGLTGAQASFVQTAFNLSAIPGSLFAGLVLDFALRRRATLALGTVFLVAMGAIVLLSNGPVGLGTMLVGGAFVGLAVMAGQVMIYALAPNIYPAAGRGTGVGFAVAVARFGSAGGPLLTGYLVAFGLGPSQMLLALLPVVALAGAAALYLAGEIGRERRAQSEPARSSA